MKSVALRLVLLQSLASVALGIGFSDILSLGSRKKPEVIEIIKWQQPVCVMPGENVPSCASTLRKYQAELENQSQSSASATKAEKVSASRVVDYAETTHLQSSEIEEAAKDEATSRETPELKAGDQRDGKYLSIGKESPIYVTRVLKSPVTATLVAYNCFPEIGVPLCRDYQDAPTSEDPPVDAEIAVDLAEGSAITLSPETEKPSIISTIHNIVSHAGVSGIIEKIKPSLTKPQAANGPDASDDETAHATNASHSLPNILGAIGNIAGKPKPGSISVTWNGNFTVEKQQAAAKSQPIAKDEPVNFWEDPNSPHFDDGTAEEKPGKFPILQVIHDFISPFKPSFHSKSETDGRSQEPMKIELEQQALSRSIYQPENQEIDEPEAEQPAELRSRDDEINVKDSRDNLQSLKKENVRDETLIETAPGVFESPTAKENRENAKIFGNFHAHVSTEKNVTVTGSHGILDFLAAFNKPQVTSTTEKNIEVPNVHNVSYIQLADVSNVVVTGRPEATTKVTCIVATSSSGAAVPVESIETDIIAARSSSEEASSVGTSSSLVSSKHQHPRRTSEDARVQ